uniref:Uncharacterized protein n=1 Tax=Picea glauca TaxID=3330 RepID=A0A124GP86_PICGL|nr:hypothetical protein ABT39_MTgene1029 [Picea glauca]
MIEKSIPLNLRLCIWGTHKMSLQSTGSAPIIEVIDGLPLAYARYYHYSSRPSMESDLGLCEEGTRIYSNARTPFSIYLEDMGNSLAKLLLVAWWWGRSARDGLGFKK